MESWNRIHYDRKYAAERDGLPDVMVNGSGKQHVMIQPLSDRAGDVGRPWKADCHFHGMNVSGDTLTAWARVTGKEERRHLGLVDLPAVVRAAHRAA